MNSTNLSLKEQILALSQKVEALTLENSILKEENHKIAIELEIAKSLNDHLRGQKSRKESFDSSKKPQKSLFANGKILQESNDFLLRRIEMASEESKDEKGDETRSSISQKEEENYTNTTFQGYSEERFQDSHLQAPALKKVFSIKANENSSFVSEASCVSVETEKKRLQDIKDRYAKCMEINQFSDIEKLLSGITEHPEWFFKLNNVSRFPSRSPFTKNKFLQIEKNIDDIEALLRKWTKLFKTTNAACLAYAKALESLSNQFYADQAFFETNKEIQHIVTMIAQFMKDNSTYLELYSKVMDTSVITSFRNFYKEVIPTYKDSKKKAQKALEEFEAVEAKYFALKKSAFLKDPLSNQSILKNYINAFRNLETGRIDYVRNLNDINVNFNIEFIEKLTSIFRNHMTYVNSSNDLVTELEGQIQVFSEGSLQKSQIYLELCNEFKKIKGQIEKNLEIKYPVSFTQNAIKEGYLFVKHDSKEFKKRFCFLQENGMMCWAKDPENINEEPQVKELVDIKLCKVRESTEYDLLYCFELVSVLMKKPIVLQADSEAAANEWIATIQKHIETLLFTSNIAPTVLKKATSDSPVLKDQPKSASSLEKSSKFKPLHSAPNSPTLKTKQSLIAQILDTNDCADCGAKDSSWISLNLATVICIECSGVHRRLGPTVSKVRSLKLDNLSLPILELFSKLNMKDVNRVWEGAIDQAPSMKPTHDSDSDRREAFIRNKYVEKVFLKPIEEKDHIKVICEALKAKNILKVLNVLHYSDLDFNELYLIDGKKQGILHYACAYSSKDIIELLIQNKCSLTLVDQDHCKPLDHSMFGHNVEVMEYLVSKLDEQEK